MKQTNNILVAVSLLLITQSYGTDSIDFVSANQKDNNLIFQMNGIFGEGSHSAFFIDTDNNAKTGYSNGAIKGADYLVEDTRLYKYPNGAIGWKWEEVNDEVKTTVTNTSITSTVLVDLINTSNSMKVNAMISTKDWKKRVGYHSMEAVKNLDSDEITYNEITFIESNEDIKNPERGTYEGSSNLWDKEGTHFYWIAKRGRTVVREELGLNKFKNIPISNEFLDETRNRFNKVREAGLKMILKVSYLQNMTDMDASLDVVLNHIKQLKPIYHEYADIIAVVQAGFIGAWGEWHSSTHGLHRSDNAKETIKKALLEAIPNNRMVQFRNPPEIIRWYPEMLKGVQAFNGKEQSRVGFHNDCFIANISDAGTFSQDSTTREIQKEYMAKISPFVAVGGEICQVDYGTDRDARSCENALETASKFHYSYLSNNWHNETIDLFKKEGCWDELKNRLGYRFVLESAKIPNNINAGDNFIAELKIKNDGFATPYNERPVYIVLQNGSQKELIKLNSDSRKWTAGKVTTVTVNAKLSNNLVAGKYKVSLWMPDASEKISNDPRYAIQTANIGTWDSSNGYNTIGDIEVLEGSVSSSGKKKIFIIGDSTVKNDGEHIENYPERGWGELLSAYMITPSNLYNEASSGASTKSFQDPQRWKNWTKSRELIESKEFNDGGYLLIQFGHNDERKTDDRVYTEAGRGKAFYTNLKFYVNEAKALGLTPVLITPVARMQKYRKNLEHTHINYDSTIRELAEDENVLLLDLQKKSWNEFNKYKDSYAIRKDFSYDDETHFSPKGAEVIAGWIKELICESNEEKLCLQFK